MAEHLHVHEVNEGQLGRTEKSRRLLGSGSSCYVIILLAVEAVGVYVVSKPAQGTLTSGLQMTLKRPPEMIFQL